MYERESVNRSQMDIKIKYVIFEPGKNIYFSTYPPPTLVHLSQCFTSASKPAALKSFDCRLSRFRTPVSTSSSSAKHFPPSWEQLYATNTSHRKQEIFLYEYPLHWILLPTKKKKRKTHNRTLLFSSILSKHGHHFDYWNHPLNIRIRVCYLDCHVLLPSITHRKPITSITAVLLPFMSYLLTLPRICTQVSRWF
jgi:hypothetical protein